MSTRVRIANIFAWNLGAGLSRHLTIVSEILIASGFQVRAQTIPRRGRGDRLWLKARSLPFYPGRVHLNVFVQQIVPSWLPNARVNVLIPMQEWFAEDEVRLLSGIDRIVCNSEHGRQVFAPLHPSVINVGFTSADRHDASFTGERTRILHIAGRARFKGTEQLVRLWQRHPDWPTLTVTHDEAVLPTIAVANIDQRRGYLSDEQLRGLQNESWLHLQPSETEGYGHCHGEGLSTGALVLTTDAPPMNELITPERGVLVEATGQRIPHHLGWRFPVSEPALEDTIAEILRRGSATYQTVMEAGRRWYLGNDARVRRELAEVFRAL
ncbi:MAG: hypothetical protein ABMA00_08360 [Gemmatimonas sp.]